VKICFDLNLGSDLCAGCSCCSAAYSPGASPPRRRCTTRSATRRTPPLPCLRLLCFSLCEPRGPASDKHKPAGAARGSRMPLSRPGRTGKDREGGPAADLSSPLPAVCALPALMRPSADIGYRDPKLATTSLSMSALGRLLVTAPSLFFRRGAREIARALAGFERRSVSSPQSVTCRVLPAAPRHGGPTAWALRLDQQGQHAGG
jgi:hypothetical protein